MDEHNNTTTKILKYSLWGCLYLTLFTVLLIGSKFLFPFITLKTIYFRSLVEISLLLYVLLALANSHYHPRMNKILWFVSGFGLIVLITSIFGLDPYRSFWGTIERGEGFLFLSHLLIYCFILSEIFKSKNDWYNFFTVSVLTNLVVGLYALLQYLGVEGILSNSAGARWASTLGNASYLGAYSLGHFWISLLLFSQRRHILWKIFFALAAAFNIYLIFKSQTRGAMVGLLIAAVVYLVALIFQAKSRKLKTSFIALFILLIALGSLAYATKDQSWIEPYPSFQRLLNISTKNITVESRLYALDSSWQGWQDRFLLGYGWENYNIAFNKYFHAEIFRDRGSQVWFDRAHNTVLDVAIASGLFGLLAYLGIYLFSFLALLKIMRHHKKYFILSLTLTAFLISHFIQNIFVFDSLPTYIMLFGIFAFIASLDNQKASYKSAANIVYKPLNLYVLSFGLVILVIALYNFNIKPAQANMIGINGLREMYKGNLEQGLDIYKESIAMHTYQTPELRQKLAETIMQRNNPSQIGDQQKAKENFDYTIGQMKQNIEAAPLNARNYLYLMALYNSAGSFFPEAGYSLEVLAYGHKALELSPTRPQIYSEMGRAAITLGRIDEGIGYFQKALDLNPTTWDSHWNLLAAYLITGRLQYADNHYRDMLNMGFTENKPNLERLGQLQSSINNYPALIIITQKLIKLDPGNVDYWTKLASAYKASGDIHEARRTAQEIIYKFPDAKASIDEFLKTLE